MMPLVAAGWVWCIRVGLALYLGAAGPLPDVQLVPNLPGHVEQDLRKALP